MPAKPSKTRSTKKAVTKAAASKSALNEPNLAALGADRVAALLMELEAGDAALKRRLRLELASTKSPQDAAREIRKRLGQLARSRGFVDWHKVRALASDLETQRGAILRIGESDAGEALDLMWQFLGLAGSTSDRCDDSSGRVGDVFRAACRDLGPLASAAKADPTALADQAYEALLDNGNGQFDGLIDALAPTLGAPGLARRKARFTALQDAPASKLADSERRVVGYSTNGPIYANELETSGRAIAIRLALQDIADAEGDVDAFIAQYSEVTRRRPGIAAELAERLVAAGRAKEALDLVEHADYDESGWANLEFEDARIAVFEAVGKHDEAQAARWSLFERSLSADHLRAFIAKLPDFEGQDALDRAFAHADAYPSVLQALAYFTAWPALDRAAALVLARAADLDGNHYES